VAHCVIIQMIIIHVSHFSRCRIIGKLGDAAARLKLSPVQLAIAWVLRRPEVTSVIVGGGIGVKLSGAENIK
jgi:hypothetical protein